MVCCNKICNVLKSMLPFVGMFMVIGVFHFTNFILLKFYPPVMNFCIFLIFFTSLFQEKTVIQKLVLAIESDVDEKVMHYTRNVTYVWTIFTFLNFLVSFVTVFMSEKIWAIYNGFVSYFLVGIVFIIEYIVRINFKRKHDR